MAHDTIMQTRSDRDEGYVRSATGGDRKVLFLYWGRRGALSQFTLQLMMAAMAMPGLAPSLSLSRQNEAFKLFDRFGDRLLPVDTFSIAPGALFDAWRLPAIKDGIARYVRDANIESAITLMPHVWSGSITPVFREAGIPYTTILHDFRPHPGDWKTALAHRALMRDVIRADRVVTLSDTVADRLAVSGLVAPERITSLFHPELLFGRAPSWPKSPRPGEPLKLLFLGRILPYKGLPLFVDAIEQLKAVGIAVEPAVYGQGSLGREARRLKALGATVVNRWLDEDEIRMALQECHAVVLSHVEASQSGIAAAALGAGVPVVITPVGGLIEQVRDGREGFVAKDVTAPAIAAAIRRLTENPEKYRELLQRIECTRLSRAMPAFVEKLIAASVA